MLSLPFQKTTYPSLSIKGEMWFYSNGLVPLTGLEPVRSKRSADFKSAMSAKFHHSGAFMVQATKILRTNTANPIDLGYI